MFTVIENIGIGILRISLLQKLKTKLKTSVGDIISYKKFQILASFYTTTWK